MPKYQKYETGGVQYVDYWYKSSRTASNHYLDYYLHKGENKASGEDYAEGHPPGKSGRPCVNAQPEGTEYADR